MERGEWTRSPPERQGKKPLRRLVTAPLARRRARACRQPRPRTSSGKKSAQKSPSSVLAFLCAFFSLRWLVVAAAVPTRASQPLVYGATIGRFGKKQTGRNVSLFAVKNGATKIKALFSLCSAARGPGARAACPAAGAAGPAAPPPGLGVASVRGRLGVLPSGFLGSGPCLPG